MKNQKLTASQHSIKTGDSVTVRKDDGSTVETTALSEPWQLGGHTWVIKLQGISGGYDLARVHPVTKAGGL